MGSARALTFFTSQQVCQTLLVGGVFQRHAKVCLDLVILHPLAFRVKAAGHGRHLGRGEIFFPRQGQTQQREDLRSEIENELRQEAVAKLVTDIRERADIEINKDDQQDPAAGK